jgi:tRNA 2-thiouridine synthesizing protein D
MRSLLRFKTSYNISHLSFDGLYGLNIKTKTGDCPADYLHYLVDNEVAIGICTPCAKNRGLDETKFFSNMLLDGGPHLIDMAIEAKVFNF